MLADIVHMILLEDGRTLEQIVEDSVERMLRLFPYPATEKFAGLIRLAMELSWRDVPDVEAISRLGEGWVGDEAIAIAIFCALRYQDNLPHCLSTAVTHKGDSDSTGAIAGNILGAWLGAEAIPADWLKTITLTDVVDCMARRVYEVI